LASGGFWPGRKTVNDQLWSGESICCYIILLSYLYLHECLLLSVVCLNSEHNCPMSQTSAQFIYEHRHIKAFTLGHIQLMV